MISSKEDTQKRMLSSKQLALKNPKLGSMANIANRSPISKFDNKEAITNNTLSSKKQLIQTKEKVVPMAPVVNSPRNSGQIIESQIIKKNSYKQNGDSTKNNNAEYNSKNNQNSLPQRYQPLPQIYKSEQTVQVNKKDGIKIVNLPNGDIYTGQISNGKYNGQGQYFFKAYNLLFKGFFKDGCQQGHGILINLGANQSVYQGGWQMGTKNGNGNYIYSSDQYYNGEWKNDQKQGNGFYAFVGGSYNGQWSKNRASGRGNLKLADGTEFKGKFQNNEFLQGTVKYANGDEYYGQMKNNLRNSEESSYINLATKIRYKGGYLNDKKNGKGTIFYQSGDQLTCIFRDGAISENEVVSYKWADGTIFQGWFKQGKPHKGTVTWPNGQKGQI